MLVKKKEQNHIHTSRAYCSAMMEVAVLSVSEQQ